VPTKSFTFTTTKTTTSLLIAAILFGVFAVCLELVFDVPLRLPGHRALPGALALLVFGEAFAPLLMVAFAAAVTIPLLVFGDHSPLTASAWIAAAVALFGLMRTRLANSPWRFAIGGLAFGLMRYLTVLPGFHHTPELARIAGHLGFGLFGGLVAFGASHLLSKRDS